MGSADRDNPRDLWTRRSALTALIAAAGAPSLASLAARLGEQPEGAAAPPAPAAPGAPAAPAGPGPLAALLTEDRRRDLTLTVQLKVLADNSRVALGPATNRELSFERAAVIFPVIRGCASSRTDLDAVTGELRFNQQLVTDRFETSEDFQAGARLGRWEMRNRSGRRFDLRLVMPMSCWSSNFDEAAAQRLGWPATFPRVSASTLEPDPLANERGEQILDTQAPEIQGLLRRWTNGRDARSLPPVQLAKFFLGQAVDHVQASGNGLRFSDRGAFEGFDLQPASVTARVGRCAEHDVANFLCTMYRAAGLPARTVIGFEHEHRRNNGRVLQRNRGPGNLRSWVEFALHDEAGRHELWVPVDPFRQRRAGSRTPPLDRPWTNFGSINDLQFTLPFAFQFHPPTTVVAHGSPAFWGWFTTPELQAAEQRLIFSSTSTPVRGGQDRNNRAGG